MISIKLLLMVIIRRTSQISILDSINSGSYWIMNILCTFSGKGKTAPLKQKLTIITPLENDCSSLNAGRTSPDLFHTSTPVKNILDASKFMLLQHGPGPVSPSMQKDALFLDNVVQTGAQSSVNSIWLLISPGHSRHCWYGVPGISRPST